MGQSEKLIKNTLIYTVGNLGSRLLSFLLLPLFSYFLTTGELGVYDLMITTISLFVPFVSIQISDAVYRWLLDSRNKAPFIKMAITNGFLIITCSTLIFITIFYCLNFFIKLDFKGYFLCMLITSCFLPFVQQTTRGLGNNKLYAAGGILNAFSVLVLNLVFLFYFNKKVEGLFIAVISSNLLTILFFVLKGRIYSYIKLRFISLKRMRDMLRYSWPLILNTISWWLINASDRYIVLYFLTVQANGIYAISSRFPSIIVLVNSIFMLAWQDHAISSENEDKGVFFSKVFHKFMVFELTLVIFLISISEPVVKLFLSDSFLESWRYMPFLYLGAAFSAFGGYLGAGYLRLKKTREIFTSSLISGVANVIISASLIPFIGLYAPALGTFVSFLIMFLLRIKETKLNLGLKIDIKKMILLTLTAICVSIFILFNNLILTAITISISFGIFIYFNWNILRSLSLMIFRKSGLLK